LASYSTYIPYNKDQVTSKVPMSPGVYIIRVQLKDESWRFIYVGQAKNLRSRLLEHLREDEPNDCLRNNVQKYIVSVCWIVIERQENRDYEEAAKIERLNPECNIQKPKP